MQSSNILKSLGKTFMVCLVFMSFACSQQSSKVSPHLNTVPQEAIHKLQALGFGIKGVKMSGTNYLVEGDIMISPEELATMQPNQTKEHIIGPTGEHYRSYNLVSTPRTIKIKTKDLTSRMKDGLKWAIGNYNDLGIGIKFQIISSGTPDITIQKVSGDGIASAGFPKSDGRPYPNVYFYSRMKKWDKHVIEHVMTHELGHCVGLRHVDYYDRSISCGSGGNEGAGSTGAVHIPGTPTATDKSSVMEACFKGNENGEFSSYDKVALKYLY